MPRPVKWSRDLHLIREQATRSRTETWSRQDIEDLFSVRPSSAQTLMKAIGEVRAIGGTYFVDRAALLTFLEEVIAAPSVEEAMRMRLERSTPPPRRKSLPMQLPPELRLSTLADLPETIQVREGCVQVTGANADAVLEGLVLLTTVMQNDFDNVVARLEPPLPPRGDTDMDQGLREMLRSLREPFPAR